MTALFLAFLMLLAEAWHDLPQGILARVKTYESGTEWNPRTRRVNGSLICGPFQIAAWKSYRLCRMARGPAGVFIAAQLLAESRERVISKMETAECPWAHWNYNDQTALCVALETR